MRDKDIVQALADRVERRHEEQRQYNLKADEEVERNTRHWYRELAERHDDIVAEVIRVADDLTLKTALLNELSNRRIDRMRQRNIIASWK